jgi:CubicO group peptidase (beta-lactamase class C family)
MEQPLRAVRLGRRAVLPAAAVGLLMPGTLHADMPPGTTDRGVAFALSKLDGIAQDAMQRTGIPGMAVAVVHQDRVAYAKGFGVRRSGSPDKVDADTVFPLASVSKPIAATVVAALVGDGVVTWDDPLIQHDPGFQMYDAWVTRQITLRDMFAHRSGLPDHAGDLLEDIGYDRAAVLYRLRYQRPDSSFRSHYAYTNFGLTAAAVSAAMASGKSWEDVSAERLYRPLGMNHTTSRHADFIAEPNRVHLHVRAGNAWVAKYTRQPDAQSPAGGAASCVRDLTAWLRLQLGRGRLDGKQIVQQDALDETHRPQIVRTPPKNPMTDHAGFYGLGWNVDYDDQGRVHLGHSGAFALGAATYVGLLPVEQLGFVALTNAQPIGVPEAVGRCFFDLVLTGKVERDSLALYGQIFATMMAPAYGSKTDYSHPRSDAGPALPASAYAGRYRNDLYGDIEITPAGDGLVLKLGPAQTAFSLRHFARDVFTYQPAGENAAGRSAVSFTVDANSQASAVTIEYLDTNGQGCFTRFMGK